MTVQRFREDINWLQVGATVGATLLPIIVGAIIGWSSIEQRLAVQEERITTHIESPGHPQTLDRVARVETFSAVSSKGESEILRRLEDIAKRLERIEQKQ